MGGSDCGVQPITHFGVLAPVLEMELMRYVEMPDLSLEGAVS